MGASRKSAHDAPWNTLSQGLGMLTSAPLLAAVLSLSWRDEKGRPEFMRSKVPCCKNQCLNGSTSRLGTSLLLHSY